MTDRALAPILLLVGLAGLIWLIRYSIRSGEVGGKGVTVTREEHPIRFRIVIGCWSALAVLLAGFAVLAWLGPG